MAERKLTEKQVEGVVATLTKIRNLFGRKGEHWIKGEEADGMGNFCLLGARKEIDGRHERLASDLLNLAATKDDVVDRLYYRYVDVNDNQETTFEDIKALISKAKRLAKSGKVRIGPETISVV